MKKIFTTSSGIDLMQDNILISTNPAEILCTLCSMLKSNNGAQQLIADKILDICIEHGGIFMDPRGPKKVEAKRGNIFTYQGSNGLVVCKCSSAEADAKVFDDLTPPIKLII